MDKYRFREIFNCAPVSIWEEDFSSVGEWLASLRERGIGDLNAFLKTTPKALRHALSLVRLIEVNEFALGLCEVRSKEELLDRWTDLFTDKTYDVFAGELLAIWEGRNQVTFQCSARTSTGRPIHYQMHWFAPIADGKMNLHQVIVVIVDITESKIKEEKLEENEKNLQLAAQIAKIGYWSRELTSNEITWSGETGRIFGIEPETTTFKLDLLLRYIHPDDRKMVDRAIQDAVSANRSYDVEYRTLRSDGAVLWAHSRGEVEFDEDGRPKRMFGIVQDITGRKRAEKALRENEEKFRKIFQQSPIAIELYDSEGLLIEANLQCLELFGVRDLDEVKGFRLFEDPNLRQIAKEMLLRGIQVHYEDEFDFDLIKAKGLYETSRSGKAFINAHISPIFHSKNKISGYLVQVEDITDQKEAEDEIQRYIERLKTLRKMDHAILAIQPPTDIVEIALKHLRKLVPCVRAIAATFNEDMTEAVILLTDTDNETKIDRGMRVPPDLFGNLEELKNGRMNRLDDLSLLSGESQKIEISRNEGILSYINFPIISRGKLIGALNLGFDRPNAFNDQYLEIVSEVALSLGIAIQNAWMIEDLNRQQQELQRYSSRLIAVQEEERKKISMELHDEVGQALTAISLNLAAMQKALSPVMNRSIYEKLNDTISLTDQTIDQIHDLSLLLRPSILDDLGLIPAVRWLIDSYKQRYGINIVFKANSIDNILSENVKMTIYRILQEALNNIVKHAEATKVTVHIKQTQDINTVIVEDNGKGFDVDDLLIRHGKKNGIGIIGIQERVLLVKGNLYIESGTGHGTKMTLEIPFHSSE